MRTPDRGRSDRGDVVLGWLLRLGLFLALSGAVLADGVSLAAAHLGTADSAATAARVAAAELATSHDVQRSYDAALASVPAGATVGTRDWHSGTSGPVTLSVTREAHTLLLRRVGPLRHWAVVTAVATGLPPS